MSAQVNGPNVERAELPMYMSWLHSGYYVDHVGSSRHRTPPAVDWARRHPSAGDRRAWPAEPHPDEENHEQAR